MAVPEILPGLPTGDANSDTINLDVLFVDCITGRHVRNETYVLEAFFKRASVILDYLNLIQKSENPGRKWLYRCIDVAYNNGKENKEFPQRATVMVAIGKARELIFSSEASGVKQYVKDVFKGGNHVLKDQSAYETYVRDKKKEEEEAFTIKRKQEDDSRRDKRYGSGT